MPPPRLAGSRRYPPWQSSGRRDLSSSSNTLATPPCHRQLWEPFRQQHRMMYARPRQRQNLLSAAPASFPRFAWVLRGAEATAALGLAAAARSCPPARGAFSPSRPASSRPAPAAPAPGCCRDRLLGRVAPLLTTTVRRRPAACAPNRPGGHVLARLVVCAAVLRPRRSRAPALPGPESKGGPKDRSMDGRNPRRRRNRR